VTRESLNIDPAKLSIKQSGNLLIYARGLPSHQLWSLSLIFSLEMKKIALLIFDFLG